MKEKATQTEREYRQVVKAMKQGRATKARQPNARTSRPRHSRPSAIVRRHWAQFEQSDHPFPHDEE